MISNTRDGEDVLVYAIKCLTKTIQELADTLREQQAAPLTIVCPECKAKKEI